MPYVRSMILSLKILYCFLGYDSILSGSDREKFRPADLHTTVTTAGRIHHLCLLAADNATQFNVDPESAALTRLLHAPGKNLKAIHAADRIRNKIRRSPPAPPPSVAPSTAVDLQSVTGESGSGSLPAVL